MMKNWAGVFNVKLIQYIGKYLIFLIQNIFRKTSVFHYSETIFSSHFKNIIHLWNVEYDFDDPDNVYIFILYSFPDWEYNSDQYSCLRD